MAKVELRTRRGNDWTDRFPAIAAAARELPVRSAVLDGEAVVPDEAGRSNLSALQVALGSRHGLGHRADAARAATDREAGADRTEGGREARRRVGSARAAGRGGAPRGDG